MQGKALIYGVQKKYYMNMAICLGLISMGQLTHNLHQATWSLNKL